jgi:hypothetical protein
MKPCSRSAFGLDVVRVGLLADLVRLRPLLHQNGELGPELLHLLLQAGRPRGGLVDLRRQLLEVELQLAHLGLRPGQLLVAVGLLGGLAAGLRLQHGIESEIMPLTLANGSSPEEAPYLITAAMREASRASAAEW